MTTETGHSINIPDAELVAQSLGGSRDAFRKIVERHQTLVCSLAYCATGSLSQSEDVAQETFLAAWKQLPEMREPSKLRAWLCAIARFVIGKELRRRGRQPLHGAEPLETIQELRGSEALPSDRAVSNEEQAILWNCVARIPEIYREPLVLFYREHQSVERVAEALGLSGDAVKQRLARGRKLLHKEVLGYVEGALQDTRPGTALTSAILGALPAAALPSKIVALGAAAKTSTLKMMATMGAVGLVILYWSFLGFLVFAGGCAGYWMRQSCAGSPGQCRRVTRFWRTLTWGLVGSVVMRELLQPGLLATCEWVRKLLPMDIFSAWYSGRGWPAGRFVMDFALAAIIAALAELSWGRRSQVAEGTSQGHEFLAVLKTRLRRWVLAGMIVPVLWLVPVVGDFVGQKVQRPIELSNSQLRKIVTTRKEAYYLVVEDQEAKTKTLEVVLPKNNPGSIKWRAENFPDWWKSWTRGTRPSWWNLWIGNSVPDCLIWTMYWAGWRPPQMVAPADEPALKVLDDAGVHPYYSKRGRGPLADPWPFWRWMPFFILPMGIMLLSRRNGTQPEAVSWQGSEQLVTETERGRMALWLWLHRDPKARRVFWLAFGTAFALAFGANALTAFGLYVLLLVGALKGVFFGLLAGIGVLLLRGQTR